MVLNDVADFIVDCEHKTAPTQVEGIPSIRTPNIGKGRLILDGVNRVSEETYELWTKRAKPQGGDIIIAREAPVGNVAIIPDDLQVCLGQRTVLVRPNKKIVDPDYLCYLLLGNELQGQILVKTNGATVAHLNMKDIRELKLPSLPSIPVQKKIASIITAYDDLVENNKQRIALLEQIAEDIYNEWFVRLRFPGYENLPVVDGIPEGWKRTKIGDIVTLNYGKALKEDDRVEGDFPVYGSSGVVGSNETSLIEGPVIIVGRKGNVGSIHWSDKNCWPIDTVYFIDKEQTSLFLYFNLQYQPFINSDAAVPGLNRSQAYSLDIVMPESTVLEQFDKIVKPMHQQIINLQLYNKNLSQTRDLLLPRLISGKLSDEYLMKQKEQQLQLAI